MSMSPEQFFLGGLLKDIDKDLSFDDLDISNEETNNISFQEGEFSSSNSPFPSHSLVLSSSLENNDVFKNIKEKKKEIKEDKLKFNKKNILDAFNCQKATKQLQNNLAEKSEETISYIISELENNFRLIINNRNGNYFCSDLLKVCNKEQRIKILKELSPFLSEDCNNEFGTHPIQHLFELSSSEEEYQLLTASFKDLNKVLLASLNSNGTFVIQKLIVHIPEKFRIDFNLIFIKFISVLSRDMYGLCAVKKFMEHIKNELIIKQVFNTIIINFISIANNQYGNYLIQYLMEKWWDKPEGIFLKKLIVCKFGILSENHYSSYICRKFFKLCNDDEKKIFLSVLDNYKVKRKGGSQQNKMPSINKFSFIEKGKNEQKKDYK